MIKQILRLLFLLAMYELGKYVTEQVYIMMTANDDVVKTKGYNGLKEYRIELKRMNNDIKK
ncbi:transcriptional activator RinB [Staphylococcus aureus]|uniref:transcriptional activator RinB n=1 Tax=Staphylococcus aureus TaxID=1280 RepID=UPI00045136DE|nr:DUF1514 family protein [Staphylococcus aureus]EWL04721.1 phage transcriptional activator RinB [Staphylococcus aureus H71538]EWV27055.1 phage transcriptional activator RinB [Staphylococcus aureus T67319]EWW48308.1 phage transcriptional activator RinB [Staphylococcus aureus H43986]EYG53800.1 phage transcriptional activator RinB [Staphylococcus aureus T42550]EYK79732.1 phage transcriptional activator RinB [Staphylococcus aureus T83563]